VLSARAKTGVVVAYVLLALLAGLLAQATAITQRTPAPRALAQTRVATQAPPASWIWARSSTANQWVAFRKTISLPASPTAAVVRIATDTKYWLWVNGRLVTFEGGLKRGPDGGSTYCDTVDLAPFLGRGDNTVAVLVWYAGKSGYSHNDSGHGGLMFQADITSDEVSYPVVSDGSWTAKVHPGYKNDTSGTQPNYRLVESNVYYDERSGASMDGWQSGAFDDSSWPLATLLGAEGAAPWNRLVARPTPLLRFTGYSSYVNSSTLPGVSTGGTIVAKLPSNLQVTPVLTVQAPAGTVIGISTDHYAEGGANGVRATYVTGGGIKTYESLGWMSGTAVLYSIPKGVRIVSLGYRESGYATRRVGSFSSSDPFFGQLWSKAARSLYLNMRDSWMDCPTRERAQWGADAVNELQESAYVFDPAANSLTAKGIRELVGWQRSDGTFIAPVPGNYSREVPLQMLASVWGFWQYYVYTGDATTVASAYPAAKKYVDLWKLGPDGLVVHRAGNCDWQDWGSQIDVRLLDNAWYAMALQSTIHLAELTGNYRDLPSLKARLSSVQTHFDPVMWNARARAYRSPGYTGGTDDRGNALAVVAGLAPVQRYPLLTGVLRANRNASPYMELYVLRAMYIMGDASSAEQRIHDRYGAMVADPGYTLWEDWTKSYGTDDHAWGGGPILALAAYGAGLVPTGPGYTSYQVQPQLGSLVNVSASAMTARGRLSVTAWNGSAGYTLRVVAPKGSTGSIVVPVASNSDVSVNGTTVFREQRRAGTLPGFTVAEISATTVTFRITSGTWTVASTVRQQPSGMRNLSLISR
jgi:alpha-L-rhamnosidase